MAFVKAQRKQAKLKIALTGPSGSGKTMSALLLAKGLGKKIALIDSENNSASLYSDLFEFDVTEIEPPYTVDKYVLKIKEAIDAKYEVLIIDSISHQWAGEGGILNQKEKMDARGGNSFTNWGKLTPEQERFKSALLHSDLHLICTVRSKQEYVLLENDKGKQAPKKVGMAPVQREGMEYEFTTVFDIAMNHEATASKDRTNLFDNRIFKITEDTGKEFQQWLNGAALPAPPTNINSALPLKDQTFTVGPRSGVRFEDFLKTDSTGEFPFATAEAIKKKVEAGRETIDPSYKAYYEYAKSEGVFDL